MTLVTTFTHLKDSDRVWAVIVLLGLEIHLGSGSCILINREKAPKQYARFCELFDLKETAPGGQTEDGTLVGNEPDREMVKGR